MPAPFLTAEWRRLAMLNYEIDPAVLAPLAPAGTEIDSFGGTTYVSVVAFLFLHTRLRGFAIPFHTDFEEVNLRFYVRRTVGSETRRGVVFVREFVPRMAIAWVARWLYNENYAAVPMRHRYRKYGTERTVIYDWSCARKHHSLELVAEGESLLPPADSLEAFITEHYWGYVRQRDGATVEYRVEHPRWRVSPAREATLTCDASALYGPAFAPFLSTRPASAFLAEGSAVTVHPGARI
jgi:uncharacterized protein YqjF (DUF2071 family)